MKKIATLILLAAGLLPSFIVVAQCPASITASAVATAASCPSSGSATISTIPAATASFTYTLTAGPAGALLNTPQSSNVFSALLPGSYTVQASCGAVQASTSFVIANGYTPISNVSAIASASCGSFVQGGTVNISVTGGSAPFQYSIIKSNDPNYADALSAYNSSPNKTVNSFGTYQVRVKDACNQFYTVTAQVGSSFRPVTIGYSPANLTSCSPTSYKFYYAIVDAVTGGEIDFSPYDAAGGVKINVYEQSAGSCTAGGSMLMSFIATGSGHSDITLPAVSSMKYFCQVITPCGDTTNQCFDASHIFDPVFAMWYSTQGCGTAGDPLFEHIGPSNWNAGIVYPLVVSLYQGNSAAGILTGTKTANNADEPGNGTLNFNNLVPGEYYMSATDACGHVFTQIIPAPAAAGLPSLDLAYTTLACTFAGISTQSGTATGVYTLNGFIPNLYTATVVIISGPSRVGTAAYASGGTVIWTDLLPGSYTAAVTTTCGTFNLSFVVPNDPNNLLKQDITAASSFTCGAGSGLVTATTNYNGGLTPAYVLVNTAGNMGVDSNATGIFSGVAPGQYYVRLKLANNTTCTNTAGYYISSNTVTIIAAGAGPQVTKKLGVICEDAAGNPLTTGTAYLTIAGGSPLLVEYKLTSSSTWTIFSSNSAPEIAIAGLTAGAVYDIRITSCGITNATQATIGKLGAVRPATTMQPCSGNAYEIALPQLSGAVYEWRNASGIIVSNAYNYTIASYNSSYNGIYTATVAWGSCTKRIDTFSLNSGMCGTFLILPVKLLSFTGRAQNCMAALSWTTAANAAVKGFELERSTDGKGYMKMADIAAADAGNYSYNDNSLLQGNIYYRLKMTDNSSRSQYSNTIVINARCNSATTQWSVYPSVAQQSSAVNIRLTTATATAGTASITVNSITGQQLYTRNITIQPGQNMYTLPGNQLQTGTYLVSIYDNKGERISAVQKLVYTR